MTCAKKRFYWSITSNDDGRWAMMIVYASSAAGASCSLTDKRTLTYIIKTNESRDYYVLAVDNSSSQRLIWKHTWCCIPAQKADLGHEHAHSTTDEKLSYGTQNTSYSCDTCKRKSCNRYKKAQHETICSGRKENKCNTCSQQFTDGTALKRHTHSCCLREQNIPMRLWKNV